MSGSPHTVEEPGLLHKLGAAPLEGIRDVRALWSLFLRTLYYIPRGKREKGAITAQMFSIGNKSLFFMTITMGFIGAIIAFQSGLQTKKLVPEMSMLGATYIKLLVRDIAASVGAMPLATRVGAGMAAEIGSMVVTEQVDALRMSAADPVDYLVVPRFVGSVVMSTSILIIGGGVALLSGMFVSYVVFDVNPYTFMNLSMLTSGDVILGVFKCVAYGGAIAVVSCHRGLTTFGGSEGVGSATTNAVVGSCFAIIVLNLFISGAGYFIFPG